MASDTVPSRCAQLLTRMFFLITEFYDPKTFITHAALLRQAFAHCGRFPTAASRRSLDRVSVPMFHNRPLSGRLGALVSRYLPTS